MNTIPEVMTADEITQLLYERDIEFLFNENIPCAERDKVLLTKKSTYYDGKLNKHTLFEWRDEFFHVYGEDRVKKYSLNQGEDLESNIQNFMDRMMSLIQDIKNSDTCHQTIIFDDGFLTLFSRMLKTSTLYNIMYYNYLTHNTVVEELKTELEGAYYYASIPDDVKTVEQLEELKKQAEQWGELVSAIFQCGNIHIMTYHPKDRQKLEDYWMTNNIDNDPDDFGMTMFWDGVTEFILRHHLPPRVRSAEYSLGIGMPDCVLSYLRESLDLFVDPKSIHYLVQ